MLWFLRCLVLRTSGDFWSIFGLTKRLFGGSAGICFTFSRLLEGKWKSVLQFWQLFFEAGDESISGGSPLEVLLPSKEHLHETFEGKAMRAK